MTSEEWRAVVGYEGIYEVSSFGRVRSLDRVVQRSSGPQRFAGCLRKTPVSKRGYPVLSMKRGDDKTRLRCVHTLVLKAFVGPRPAGWETRHLDGDKTNNRLTNLCYGTASENAADRVVHGTSNRGERNGGAKLTRRDVRKIFALRQGGALQREIAAKMKISREHVRDILNRKRWAWFTQQNIPA